MICDDTNTSPCIEWVKTSGNLRINVTVFIGGALASEEVDPHGRPERDGEARTYASTSWTKQLSSPYHITHAVISFNTDIYWVRANVYPCDEIPVYPYHNCQADPREVANHEMGHAEGLAHEGSPTVAVMRQRSVSWWNAQTDDIHGIIAIHGAYP